MAHGRHLVDQLVVSKVSTRGTIQVSCTPLRDKHRVGHTQRQSTPVAGRNLLIALREWSAVRPSLLIWKLRRLMTLVQLPEARAERSILVSARLADSK
jgi:hypothetical protein